MLKNQFHFNDLPEDIYVELDAYFHEKLFRTAISSLGFKAKTSLGKIFDTYDTQALRLWSQETRLTIAQLKKLQEITKFNIEEIEKSITSLGIRSDNKKRIYDPKLPFLLKDLVYVYSHLVFDGCGRPKGSYFMAAEKELLDYHKSRLNSIGEIKINFNKKEKQLYLPWTLVYIVQQIFQVESFKSMKAEMPEKLKELAISNKEATNEIIKAAIIDEGWIEDKISFAISNENLCRDVWEITKAHYEVGRFPEKPRERIGITGKKVLEYRWIILSKSMKNFYENIKLPLSHKQERLEFAVKRQTREWYKRKPNETKKLIIESLMKSPKSIKELSFELNVRTTSILNLINGVHCPTQNTNGLKDLEIIGILEYRRNTKGERTGKFPIYYIVDEKKGEDFIKNM